MKAKLFTANLLKRDIVNHRVAEDLIFQLYV